MNLTNTTIADRQATELVARGNAAEAILEHSFAIHFMQDALAAGHPIQAGWSIDNERQRRRHDFYKAKGLAVGERGHLRLARERDARGFRSRALLANDSLSGESKEVFGSAVQLLASVNARVLVPSGRNVDFFTPAIGVSGGLSYRWGTYLTGRLNRSVAERNVGISDAFHFASRGHARGFPHVTLLDQGLRWPSLYEVPTSYASRSTSLRSCGRSAP